MPREEARTVEEPRIFRTKRSTPSFSAYVSIRPCRRGRADAWHRFTKPFLFRSSGEPVGDATPGRRHRARGRDEPGDRGDRAGRPVRGRRRARERPDSDDRGARGWSSPRSCGAGATGRTVSGLLVLTLVIMTVKTTITFATGNTFIYFVQPVVVDAVVGAVFLTSCASERPFVARLAPDFCPMHASLSERPSDLPALPWAHADVGTGHPGEGRCHPVAAADAVDGRLHPGQERDDPHDDLATTVVTVVWSVVVCRQEGLLGPTRR